MYTVGETIPFDAEASSGLKVDYRILEGSDLISDAGTTRTAEGVGRVEVEVRQFGDENYSAKYLTKSFSIVSADVSIEFETTQAAVYDGSPKEFVIENEVSDLTYLITYNGSILAPSEVGVYAVEVTAYNDFSVGYGVGSLEIISTELLSVSSPSISFYPNPAINDLTFTGLTSDAYEAIIYNLNGKIKKHTSIQRNIDLTTFTSGIYIVELWSNDTVVLREKLMIEK